MTKIIEQPTPQGKYLPAVRHKELIYTSGMTPRKAGNLLYSGKIRVSDSIESHRDAVPQLQSKIRSVLQWTIIKDRKFL